ncbi:nitroreductase family protein, partial [Candidatus Aerophobetes bacterium]|nr:nitroreductase family protein [Candidatus Aerophobetes bacterium]
MELMTAIKGRRAVRRFREEPIPLEYLKKILEAGVWA